MGREFSNRAAQPGETGERLSAERDARSNLTGARVRAQKVVGGDEITYITVTTTGSRQIQLLPFTTDHHDWDGSFIAPADLERLKSRAAALGLLILRGEVDSGRSALGRHLLLDHTREGASQLHPETDLSALDVTDLKPGGYLLADLPQLRAATLHAFDLDRLAAQLRDRHRLIITVDTGTRLPDAVERYVADVRGPDPRSVLEAHLARLVGSATDARTVLSDGEVHDVCRDILASAKPRFAVHIATLIADSGTVDLRARLGARSDFDLDDWFANLPDLDTQALAISVAVLGGEPYEQVAMASAALKRRLEPDNQPPRESRPFNKTVSSRLRGLGAHLVPSSMLTRHGGTAPGQVVRYQDGDRPQQVILHVWNEYDDIRPEFLTWLRLCARSEVGTVRIRAAVAAGLLATKAFDHIRATVILPWAKSPDPGLREAAAIALGTVSDVPGLTNAAHRLVDAWSSGDAIAKLQATAIRAWRVKLADGDCENAVSLLDLVGSSDEPAIIEALCETIAEMLEYEDSVYSARLLTMLRTWMSGRSPEKRLNGKLAFLLSAADLVRQRPDGGLWPTMLAITEDDGGQAVDVAELWAQALNSSDFNREAKEVLAEWGRLADSSLRAVGVLASLMATCAQVRISTRTERIIALAVDRWTHAPRSRAAILSALQHLNAAPRSIR
ncbi:hypothetical protein [Herbidospora mongoliensis]|uniref:hypothetical protein n=1 Tax=Herbidospora mongoliensis TaxID=688067 RepID=UPI000836A1D5|nr:hypothetical protein [Herbidospora mongoliensis]